MGLIIGIPLAYLLFLWLKKRSEKKLLNKLNEGLGNERYSFLKYPEKLINNKEVKDERDEEVYDRGAILKQLIGGKSEIETRKPEVSGDKFYKRASRDAQERRDIPPSTVAEYSTDSGRSKQTGKRVVKLD